MNAVIYARYSSDRQREESIEGQLRECTDYAMKNNLTLLGTYVDRALSARTADRPDFQRMIADSAKGLFDVVLVWKLDRFSRDRYDSLMWLATLLWPDRPPFACASTVPAPSYLSAPTRYTAPI